MKKEKQAKTLFTNHEKTISAIKEKAIHITTTMQCNIFGYADGSYAIYTEKERAWVADKEELEVWLTERRLQ